MTKTGLQYVEEAQSKHQAINGRRVVLLYQPIRFCTSQKDQPRDYYGSWCFVSSSSFTDIDDTH